MKRGGEIFGPTRRDSHQDLALADMRLFAARELHLPLCLDRAADDGAAAQRTGVRRGGLRISGCPEPDREAAERVEDCDGDERELDGRADCRERRSEAASVASERQKQRDVLACVERGSGKRKERDDDADGREAPRRSISSAALRSNMAASCG